MDRPLTQNIRSGRPPLNLDGYQRAGGYVTLRATIGKVDPQHVIETVTKSGLSGRGGGGFSTGRKWQAMPKIGERPGPRYFIINADEMEPGTFKDRLLMEGDPHQLLEGLILSAYAVEANHGIIFVRGEYIEPIRLLKKAVAEAYEAGFLGENIFGSDFTFSVDIHVSVGRYICGEETALLNALEGKRAIPRSKPPLPQTSGLFGQPTIINNVETICNIPHIIGHGVEWYQSLGTKGEAGTRIFGVSGRVKYPGNYELPIGTSMQELIENHAGGMRPSISMVALLPGGASTGFILPNELDMPMSASAFAMRGHRLGTGSAIVLDDQTCPIGFITNLQRFFGQESCGWCAPCRDGLPWVEQTLSAIEAGDGTQADLALLSEMTEYLSPGRTFCALAPGAMASLQTGLSIFREDFERHITHQGCPWH